MREDRWLTRESADPGLAPALGCLKARASNGIAEVFKTGRSQAVRLPASFRFTSAEVFVRRDPETGDVILSAKPKTWDSFFRLLHETDVPADFLDAAERNQNLKVVDPMDGWSE